MVRRVFRALVVCLVAAAAAGVAPAPALAQTTAESKIAVVDVRRILSDSQTAKTITAPLEEFGKQQQSRLQTQKDEIDQLVKRIQDGGMSLSEDKLQELRDEAQRKQIELQRATDDANREYGTREARALKQIEDRVMPLIQKLGDEGGFSLIFNKFESGLVFADSSTDVTDQLIQMLDAAQGQGG